MMRDLRHDMSVWWIYEYTRIQRYEWVSVT